MEPLRLSLDRSVSFTIILLSFFHHYHHLHNNPFLVLLHSHDDDNGKIHNHPLLIWVLSESTQIALIIIITIIISGSTDPEPILDPQAIYMIPQEWGRAEVGQH